MNLADLSSVAFPVTEVDVRVDGKEEGEGKGSEEEKKIWDACELIFLFMGVGGGMIVGRSLSASSRQPATWRHDIVGQGGTRGLRAVSDLVK